MKFSEYLRTKVHASWNASFEHPFVTGVADGTLPLENFKYYVLNDAYYLSVFAKVQALGAAKAADLYIVEPHGVSCPRHLQRRTVSARELFRTP